MTRENFYLYLKFNFHIQADVLNVGREDKNISKCYNFAVEAVLQKRDNQLQNDEALRKLGDTIGSDM
jgi:hypothetical protein